jgi:hypothetical protein
MYSLAFLLQLLRRRAELLLNRAASREHFFESGKMRRQTRTHYRAPRQHKHVRPEHKPPYAKTPECLVERKVPMPVVP